MFILLIVICDVNDGKLYYFDLLENGTGNIIYTIFDKNTMKGISSFTVRYGAASKIKHILFNPYPKSQIELKYADIPILPLLPVDNGTIIPM